MLSNHHDHKHDAHDAHAHHSVAMFKQRFWLSLVLTLPILYYSVAFQNWFNYRALEFPGSAWVEAILATILFFYGGGVFLSGALSELRHRQPGMMTLIALAISVAYIYSLAVTLGLEGMPLYWELATLIVVMLLGHWIEMASVEGASRALEHLAKLIPTTAHKLVDGQPQDVPVSKLKDGDTVLIRPGEQVPVDGRITEGGSSFNESFLTGESRPVEKQTGDEVLAGAVNGEAAVNIQVTRTGEHTTLSQIQRLVEEAQQSRSQFATLANRAAFYLTIIAISAGVITFFSWLLFGFELNFALTRAVTVLVMACPHALGLAIPLVIVNATAISAKNGLLIRNREAFERARKLQFVAFDKTGTLTEGVFEVRNIVSEVLSESDALQIAASLEGKSEHPLAAAIVRAAQNREPSLAEVSDFTVTAGKGVAATLKGTAYSIGRPEWLREQQLTLPPTLQDALDDAEDRGESVIVLADKDKPLALFALADKVRQHAKDTISQLKAANVTPVMITGDAVAVAQTVAAELGIEHYHARVLPQDKAKLVEALANQGQIAFVGDGINDAPALVKANLGVAIGAGTNVAIESADVVLIDDNPIGVLKTLQLSKATYSKMLQNLFWATGYNVIALPLAAGVLYSAGLVLTPAVGAIFMSASTVIVAINAMLLRRIQL